MTDIQAYNVVTPPNVFPGQQFRAILGGRVTMVIVPIGCAPNSTLRVHVPSELVDVKKYSVKIPYGTMPGDRFQANLGGKVVMVLCPPTCYAGGTIIVDINNPDGGGEEHVQHMPSPIRVPDTVYRRNVPDHFMCPITGCIMSQPVVTPGGVSYDYDAISEWLRSHDTDPATNQKLCASQLYPNRALYTTIYDFVHDRNPVMQ